MARLIAFDQKMASALRQQMPQHQTFEHGAADVVDFAKDGPETLVAVLPADAQNLAGVAVFRRPKIERPAMAQPPQKTESYVGHIQPAHPEAHEESVRPFVSVQELRAPDPLRIRAGGFLGLRDEAVFEEEQKPPEKRSWWRKFWDED